MCETNHGIWFPFFGGWEKLKWFKEFFLVLLPSSSTNAFTYAGQRKVPRDRTPLDQLKEEGGKATHQSQGQGDLKVEQKFGSIQEIVELYELVHERHSF